MDTGSGSSHGTKGSAIKPATDALRRRAGVPEYSAEKQIREVIGDIVEHGHSRTPTFAAGKTEERMTQFALSNGIVTQTDTIYFNSRKIAHALRSDKQNKSLAVDPSDLATFMSRRHQMKLYYDRHTKNFTYVDKANKYIVRPGYSFKDIRTKGVLAFVTAQRLNPKEIFDKTRYKEI